MTKTEKLKQITNKVCELLKDVEGLDPMELKEGCVIIQKDEGAYPGCTYEGKIVDVYGGGQIADTGDYSDIQYTVISHHLGIEDGLTLDELDDEDIIGSPIRLDEILAALQKCKGEYWITTNGLLTQKHKSGWNVAELWKFGKSLTDQLEETINFLHEIFCKN